MINPKVAIIIPIYNVEKYLEQCIESAVNQTYKNLSIILINDGSNDSSYDIAKAYAQKDDRIILLSQENGGLSTARNAGLDICFGKYNNEKVMKNADNMYEISTIQGVHYVPYADFYYGGGELKIISSNPYFLNSIKDIAYIHFLDSDDYLALECTEIGVQEILSTNAQIVMFNFRCFLDRDANITEKEPFIRPNVYGLNIQEAYTRLYSSIELMKNNTMIMFPISCGILFDINILKNICFTPYVYNEEYLFGTSICIKLTKIKLSNFIAYHYRDRLDSISTGDRTDNNVKSFLYDLTLAFDDPYMARRYWHYASYVIIAIHISNMIKDIDNMELSHILKKQIVFMLRASCYIKYFPKDPKNILPLLDTLNKYDNLNLMSKIRIWTSVKIKDKIKKLLLNHCPIILYWFKKIKKLLK